MLAMQAFQKYPCSHNNATKAMQYSSKFKYQFHSQHPCDKIQVMMPSLLTKEGAWGQFQEMILKKYSIATFDPHRTVADLLVDSLIMQKYMHSYSYTTEIQDLSVHHSITL